MGTRIWECSQGHIHVSHQGREIEFKDIYDLVSALEMWLEFAMSHELEDDSASDDYWKVITQATRN